jgi:hypothetical protein
MNPIVSESALMASVKDSNSALKPTVIEPLKDFIYLQRLPVELQAKIWKLAVPPTIRARVVSIIPKVKGN